MKKLKKKTKKRIIWIVILVLVFGGGYLLVSTSGPQGEDLSRAVQVMDSKAHVPIGADADIEYTSNPPTSGPHYGTPAKPGFRTEPIADGHVIHGLEHGLVWVAYHPRIGDEVEQLRELPDAMAIIAPRAENETDIAVAAWGRLDTFDLEDGAIDELDIQRIDDFIRRYSNQGPERIPPGQHGGV